MRPRRVLVALALLLALGVPPPSACAAATPVNRWVSVSAANVRTGPSTSYASVGTVSRGTQVTGEVVGSWLHITSYSFRNRYIALSTLATSPVQVTWYVAARDYQVVVRSSPSTSAGVVRRLSGGAAVSGRSAGAWFVLAGGGYVSTAVLAPTADLTTVNGRIPQESLCSLPLSLNSPWVGEPGYDPRRVRYLPCAAASSLQAMDVAYVRDTGTHLVQDLTYRDYAEQVYWYELLGYPRAAVPGTSNHGFGTAVDFWESPKSPFRFGQAGDAWLTAHGAAYGWDRPAFMDAGGSNPEYWHYNYTG